MGAESLRIVVRCIGYNDLKNGTNCAEGKEYAGTSAYYLEVLARLSGEIAAEKLSISPSGFP